MRPASVAILLYALSALSPAASAQGPDAPLHGLDLRLPDESVGRAWAAPSRSEAVGLPDLGSRSGDSGHGRGARRDLPYGAGYEARHGRGTGAGHGRGRGR